ncbi:type VI secretion system tube protein TssD [Enterobacter sp.]|uniref:type VI secretion system tube protein TssD n=1 Tax=Enterobacter sp. TaxID=42895 RepID=UPI00296EE227|nr:type VI secretion system tube protein TssD [Enterobacter sp.]
MSHIVYLRINGERQGNISAGCGTEASIGNRWQLGHENEIMCLSLAQSMTSTGQQAHHQGLQFCKMIDKSSPLLMQAINDNEPLKLDFDFYRINPFGRMEKYYRIELRGALINRTWATYADNLHSEYITVSYDYILCQHLIARTEYSYLVFPDNYNRLFPVQQTAYIAPPPPEPKREITLVLGVFFDGTGNNAINTQNMLEVFKAKHYQISDPDSASILEKTAEEMGMTDSEATSYLGYYTNIHWLSTLYDTDLPPEKGIVQQGIYIEGIGTEDGKPDSLLGQGLGISDTGVIAKTDKAVGFLTSKIQRAIAIIKQDLSPSLISVTSLQFDIFGFSRGAAAARHFANRIQNNDPAIVAAILQGLDGTDYTGAPAGKTRFIGIMDTVAAIGTPVNGLNPHSADTGSVNIILRPGVAEKVFHITALNECRFNFALNSVRLAWPELALPGAHSDIGGGYLPVMRESVFLTRPQGETVPDGQPETQTEVCQRALAQKTVLAALPAVAPLLRTHPVNVSTWSQHTVPSDRNGQMQKRSFAALTLQKRIVRNGWANVVLRVMIAAAQEAGVVFTEVEKNDDVKLPAELMSFYQKALAQGKAVRAGRIYAPFLPAEMDTIARDYIHCSANWNAVEIKESGEIYGGAWASETLGFINRPDENWRRTVYNMDGKNL